MDVKYKKKGKELFIYVYGELDEYNSKFLRAVIDDLIIKNLDVEKVIFDLSGLSFMDSTGIGLLIGRYKKLKSLNIKTYLTGATINIEKVIEISGLYDIMPIY